MYLRRVHIIRSGKESISGFKKAVWLRLLPDSYINCHITSMQWLNKYN